MDELVEYLKKNKITIGTCESCTGGLFAARLCDYSGISSVFKGSIVTYQNEIKINVVGVNPQTIEKYGVVSEQVACEMAKMAQKKLNVDLCISYTGNAGPDICDNKPVGRVYCAMAYKDEVVCLEFNLEGNRNEIRSQVIEKSIDKILNFLGKSQL